MGKLKEMTAGWNKVQDDVKESLQTEISLWSKIKKVIGILVMLALGYLGSVTLLTPANVLLYQLVWLLPGMLITEWTRTV